MATNTSKGWGGIVLLFIAALVALNWFQPGFTTKLFRDLGTNIANASGATAKVKAAEGATVKPSTTAAPKCAKGTKYVRSCFGAAWSDKAEGVEFAGNGCATRDDVLKRDLYQVKMRTRCIVESGTLLSDPYTGKTIQFKRGSSLVDIDHMIPLSFAWSHGADAWDANKRLAFANDPGNLLTVDARSNRARGDLGPSQWRPKTDVGKCYLGTRILAVAAKYGLDLPKADRDAATAMAGRCGK